MNFLLTPIFVDPDHPSGTAEIEHGRILHVPCIVLLADEQIISSILSRAIHLSSIVSVTVDRGAYIKAINGHFMNDCSQRAASIFCRV
jgi:hypothetical protein